MRANPARPFPVPSHSVEAEQAVLGSLMIDPKAWATIADVLAPVDFYLAEHRVIFEAIGALARAGKAHDVVMVSQHLERAGQLNDAGGLACLGPLARDTPTAANVKDYAHAVRDRAMFRGLSCLAQALERGASEAGERTASELIAAHHEALIALQARSRDGKGLVSSRDLAVELVDDLDRRQESNPGLCVGLVDFDQISGGLENGDLVVIAARPGMGKTALLVTIAGHVSEHAPVAVFSAEMPAQQLMRRALALGSSVPQGRLRRGERLTDADWQAITPAIGSLAERKLWIDETALPSLQHIRAEAMSLKARHGLGLVLVDYVQLVSGRGKNRYEELRDVAYGLKALAKDLAVPIVVLAQLNRGVEARDEKRPHMSDLRDSGAIEEAADIIGLLYSEGYYDPDFSMPHVLECAIKKNRNGERGDCLWHFSGEYSRVTALEPGPRAQYRHLREKQRRKGSNDDL